MSAQAYIGRAYEAELLEEISLEVADEIPRATAEFNRRMNWERAARLEREERGNISWWSTKK